MRNTANRYLNRDPNDRGLVNGGGYSKITSGVGGYDRGTNFETTFMDDRYRKVNANVVSKGNSNG